MLRSLVGSEMCIRDRFGATVLVPLLTGFSPSTALFTAGTGTLIYILCTCLLYTSDAADDLHCVDFGGRRNIKKKTYTRKPRRI